MMSTETLRTLGKELLSLGRDINKLSRANSLTKQTHSEARSLTNDHMKSLVLHYNTIAEKINENSEHYIDLYVISEYVNGHDQLVLTASNER